MGKGTQKMKMYSLCFYMYMFCFGKSSNLVGSQQPYFHIQTVRKSKIMVLIVPGVIPVVTLTLEAFELSHSLGGANIWEVACKKIIHRIQVQV